MNILTKISMRLKLFKIHKKNFKKNDKINKNTHIKVIFLNIIDIDIIKDNIYQFFYRKNYLKFL